MPAEAAGYRVYFRAKVDSTGEVKETNEHNNWSGTDEWYPVTGDCDLKPTYIRLTNNRTTLKEGDAYGLEMVVKNQGTTNCPMSIRSAYKHQKPGQSDWDLVATDGTDAKDLTPGKENYEYTKNEPFTADTPGTHYIQAHADYLKAQPETDETNNSITSSFTVTAYKPDFIVSDLYIKVGSTTYRDGGTIKRNSYIHPYCVIKNIGTSGTHPGFRIAYDIDGDRRDSDGIDKNELCAGCSTTEYVSKDSIKLGDTGTRTYKCDIDYENKVTESNKSNNSATMSFTVK